MKLIKNKIKVTPDVITKEMSMGDYISLFCEDFNLFSLLQDHVINERIYGIFRKVNESDLDVYYIVKDDIAEEFKDWIDITMRPILSLIIITPETEIIDKHSDEEIINMYNDPENFSKEGFSKDLQSVFYRC